MRLRSFHYPILTIILLFIVACSQTKKEVATMLIYGGPIYTVDSTSTKVEAVAIKNKAIIFTGSLLEAEEYKNDQTKIIDLKGKTMTPGLIEGHGHFMGLGYNELNLDLINTTSYEEIVNAVAERIKTAKPGEWIIGRGWHQEKWNEELNQQFSKVYDEQITIKALIEPIKRFRINLDASRKETSNVTEYFRNLGTVDGTANFGTGIQFCSSIYFFVFLLTFLPKVALHFSDLS